MRSYFIQYAVALFLVFTGLLQIAWAFFTGTTYYIPMTSAGSGPYSLAHEPIIFVCALVQAAAFIAWGAWLLVKERR
jgi:hypothetical protein